MVFGIFANESRDKGFKTALSIAEICLKEEITPVFEEKYQDSVLNTLSGVLFSDFEKVSPDIIMSIGGDGTFLSMVSQYRQLDCEFIGVNKGSIGFLTGISADNLEDAILKLKSGNYRTVDRTQLFVEVFNKDGVLKASDICLNDCMIARGLKPHITKLLLLVDGHAVERYQGDGILVSTATGSTAYSLAAGGPLLMPDMPDMIITPICSHSLHDISYVTGPNSVIEIKLDNFESVPIICPDGHDFVTLEPFDCIRITSFEKKLRTININEQSFFSDVRKKITQRGYFYENR